MTAFQLVDEPSPMTLFGDDYALPTADYDRLDPDRIHVDPIPVKTATDYQRVMSRAVWRPSPGRNLAFFVRHDDDLLGLMFFSGGVINMGARDTFLGLPSDPTERGKALCNYADLSVCVSIQPAGWRWNLGKLIAMVAYTMGDAWTEAYDDELKGVITTSLDGRSSQYNRIYKLIGFTKGWGHEHVTDLQYGAMMRRMRSNNVEPLGTGTHKKNRLQRIKAYAKWARDNDPEFAGDSRGAFHGKRRGIYYHAAVEPSTRGDVIRHWFDRWGAPRFARMRDADPPYRTGRPAEAASSDAPVVQTGEDVFATVPPLQLTTDPYDDGWLAGDEPPMDSLWSWAGSNGGTA